MTPLEQRLAADGRVSTASLRLDAKIATRSSYRLFIYAIIAVWIALMAYLADLNYWQLALLLFSAIVSIVGAWLTQLPVVHISQPALTQSLFKDWQLMMSTSRGEALWRADLLSIQDYGPTVVLKFAVSHPQRRSISHALFRDQMTAQSWHQLKVIAQLIK
ncbi:hypothetical protein [Psychrobacter pygoscelis]|uniref:hypothetical protein n=1 Tax=Psychrobacter pygoscelis TaxID=2488563 RepID=UPI00103CA8C9|nr:hypothetical protein [Psychrobacter pygoscelis]